MAQVAQLDKMTFMPNSALLTNVTPLSGQHGPSVRNLIILLIYFHSYPAFLLGLPGEADNPAGDFPGRGEGRSLIESCSKFSWLLHLKGLYTFK